MGSSPPSDTISWDRSQKLSNLLNQLAPLSGDPDDPVRVPNAPVRRPPTFDADGARWGSSTDQGKASGTGKMPNRVELDPASTVADMFHHPDHYAGLLSRTAPLDALPVTTERDIIPATCARLDAQSRLTDQQLFQSLGWAPGQRLLLRRTALGLCLRTHTNPIAGELSQALDPRGRLLIPRDLRQALRLLPGEPLLLLIHHSELHILPVSDLTGLLLPAAVPHG